MVTAERKRLTKRYTDNVEAYQLYMKGRYHWHKFTDEAERKGREYFLQAIEVDPNYALAYAGLADTYGTLGAWEVATLAPKEAMPRAKAAAMRALELDDDLAEAHASLAYVLLHYDWNWPQAEKEFTRAIQLNTNYANAHHRYAHYLMAVGRTEESLAESYRALEVDPLDTLMSVHLVWHYNHARQYDRAIEAAQKILDLEPNTFEAQHYLGWAYEQKGRYSEAISEFQRAIPLSGNTTRTSIVASLGHAYATSGARDKAKKVLDDLTELSKQRYVSPYDIAIVYIGLAEKEQALSWLEKAYEDRSGWLAYLNVDPRLDSLRSDSRFVNLLGRIGLAQTLTPHPAGLSEELRTETWQEEGVRLSASVAATQSWWSSRAAKLLTVGVIALVAGLGYWLLRPIRQTVNTGPAGNLTFTQLTYQSGPEFFPSLSPDGKSLAYAGRSAGNWDIYLQRVGGSNPLNLTKDSPADDSQPAFSPDGERIAFRSERDGGGIYLMGATGESITRISDFGYSPSWSPDGGQILVGTEKTPQPSTRPTKSQLWKIDVKSGERRMISEGDALQPHYSPHQQRIVYWSRPSKAGQREDIWTIPAEGGEAVRVTSGSTIDVNPVWSPDGKYLYFSSSRGGSMNIWRVPVDEKSGATAGEPEAVTTIGAASSALQLSLSRDGRRLAYIAQEDIRNLRKVAFDPSAGKPGGEPQWITRGSLQLWFPDPSPDGEWLTACSRGQQRHIYLIRTDGTELRDLTDDNFRHDGWPRWSPDGKRIAFTSRRTGDYEVWVINRDGSGMRQVTDSEGGHYSPWSPDGSTIAYSTHVSKNDCVIVRPDKSWDGQQLTYLPALSDATLSFEGWAWSSDGKKLAGIKHLPNGLHSGIGVYDPAFGNYDWFTDFGDWPVWLNDNRRLLFVSQGKIFLFDTATRKYEPVLTVTDQDVDIGSPSLSPDNKTLYFTFVAAEADIWLMTLK